MKTSIFFYKELTKAEVGNTGTHEVYIRFPNDFDYKSFFHNSDVENGSVIEVVFSAEDTSSYKIDSDLKLRFVYFVNSNKEKRVPSLKTLFDSHNVEEGDIVCLESRNTDGVISYHISFYKKGEIRISPNCICYSTSEVDNKIKKNTSLSNQPQQSTKYIDIITAAKTKPFILLAGISGTGKSRIVRELARACWDEGSDAYNAQKPQNFEMIQVKPNWHDSTELMGYVSRVSGKPVYIIGDFLRFVVKAWENIDVPHFLCLDEMNLAPVEQYFAEYLSVIESRKLRDGKVMTDAILKKCSEQWFFDLTMELTEDDDLRRQFNDEGIALPPNLIVVGTVNMDETTFSFSRKVLDRAMTIEMNEVDLWGGLDNKYERIGKLSGDMLIGTAVEGVDVYAANKEVCDMALNYLKAVNEVLEGTPFKVAYRTRNEFLLYVVNNLPYTIGEDGTEYSRENVIATALDEITSMKILSRIEGDDTKVPKTLLTNLKQCIEKGLSDITGDEDKIESVSLAKLDEMLNRLESGYTSFWS